MPRISTMPVFVTADAIWPADGEVHSDPHRYWITIYVYNKQVGHYVQFDKFATKNKRSANILQSEKTMILTNLTKAAADEAARHIIVK
jgi:alpha-glucosidase (family GH31 glycosyl hydrolase)